MTWFLMGAVFGLGWVRLPFSSCLVDLFSWFMQIGCLAKLDEELKQGRAVITYGGGGEGGALVPTCEEKWRPHMSPGVHCL